MKALERYVKKNSKANPFGKTEAKGPWKGAKGPQMKDQYAKETGTPIVSDDAGSEAEPGAGLKGYKSIKSGGEKKKQRSYLAD